MPKDHDLNHTIHLSLSHERMTTSALDCALRDYREVFGDDRYRERLQYALEAHAKAEAIRRG